MAHLLGSVQISSPRTPQLSRAVKLLALTVAAAADLISDPSLSGAKPAALASHLDSSIALLDACNASLAEIEFLRRSRLLLRFSLHLLAGEDHSLPLTPDRIRWAHKAIAECEMLPRREVRGLAGDLTRHLAPGEQSRSKMSTVRRALYAVEAMAGLVMATVMAVLSGGEEKAPTGVKISRGEVLKEVEVAVFGRLRAGFPGEVEVVEAAVRAVVGVIDGEDDGEKAARLGSTVEELEGAMEELTEGLDSAVGCCEWVDPRDDAFEGCRVAEFAGWSGV